MPCTGAFISAWSRCLNTTTTSHIFHLLSWSLSFIPILTDYPRSLIILLSAAIHDPQILPGATGYIFRTMTGEPAGGDRLHNRIENSTKSLEKLWFLLQSSLNESSTETTIVNPTITIGSRAFISSPQLSNEKADMNMTETYSKL
jgi:hypothetical protein